MKSIWIITMLWLLGSCAQPAGHNKEKGETKSNSGHSSVPDPGIVHKHVQCQADTTYSYALYLPSTYSDQVKEGKMFPVIFFFDAHKRGDFPVENYAPLAEEYGFIIAGSNNSGNGQKQEQSDKAVSMMFKDVKYRFKVNPDRMTASGFSGGARVAAGVALFRKEHVETVIGCAAGFPQVSVGYNADFSYLGIVGDKDFNYLELKNLDKTLNGTPIKHFVLIYDGKHDWPPKEVMRESFEFLQFEAMRKKPELRDPALIEAFLKRNDSLRTVAKKTGDVAMLEQTDRKVMFFLSRLAPVKTYRQELDSLKETAAYAAWQKKTEETDIYEQNQKKIFVSAMQSKDLKWWKKQIDELKRKPDLVNQRLMNFISLASYMYASNALKSAQVEGVEKYLTIYEEVDPENPEVYYLTATFLARVHRQDEVLDKLQQCADHGFAEYERMINSKDFASFAQDPKFLQILNQVKENSDK
jgi:predicted esterase